MRLLEVKLRYHCFGILVCALDLKNYRFICRKVSFTDASCSNCNICGWLMLAYNYVPIIRTKHISMFICKQRYMGNYSEEKKESQVCICSPNSSTVVLASFCCSYPDFPHCQFGHPPNMMTRVHPGSKLMAVVVCLNRLCVAS